MQPGAGRTEATGTPSRFTDVHAHFVPQAYRQALLEQGINFPDGSPIPEWSAAGHVEALDELGITTAMLSASRPGVEVDGRPEYWARLLNESGADARTEHPGASGSWLPCHFRRSTHPCERSPTLWMTGTRTVLPC